MQTPFLPYAEEIEAVASSLATQVTAGLQDETVRQRQQEFGANELAAAPPTSAWRILAGQFTSVLIVVLIGASVLSAFIGNVTDAVVIACVVAVNSLFGFYQEYRAERSLSTLKGMLPVRARVRRGERVQDVPAESLVPGDVVLIEAGDRVPADGRLAVAATFEVDESTLTGESAPVSKSTDALPNADLPLGDRTNMVHMNTLVTRGRGEFITTATGAHTAVGQLSQQLAATVEPPSPLQVQLDQLGRRLGTIALTLVVLLSFLQLLRGETFTHVLIDGIALAVAAMPEGLPVVVTVTLAVGMHQLARHRAIVKRLASVETLGCTTVICSDKTGTLTLNEMTVRAVYFARQFFQVTGEGYLRSGTIAPTADEARAIDLSPLLLSASACNDSRLADAHVVGDPMEGALLVLAEKGGISKKLVQHEFPRITILDNDYLTVDWSPSKVSVELLGEIGPRQLLVFLALWFTIREQW